MRATERRRFLHRIQLGFLLGAACAFALWGLDNLGFLRSIERSTIDVLFRARGIMYPSPRVVLVEADDTTITRYPWPLPREIYASLVDRLTRAGASTIAFDILIPTPSGNSHQDEALVQATRRSGKVLHSVVFNFDYANDPSVPVSMPGNAHTILPRFAIRQPGKAFSHTVWGTAALLPLQKYSAGLGHLNAPPEADGVLRRIPHLLNFRGGNGPVLYPSLALAAAAHSLKVDPADIKVVPGEIHLPAKDGLRRIPLDQYGRTWVNWIGPHRSFPTYSFNSVLDGQVPDAMFKDKVVLLGVTALGSFERHATPFSSVQPAVELQANALDDILMDRPLRAASQLTWILLLLLMPALVGAITLATPIKRSGPVVLALLLGLVAWAWICISHLHLVLPVAAPAVAALAAFCACLGFRQFLDAAELRAAEERYYLAVRGANDGLWDWNLQTGEVYYSPRWSQMLGLVETDTRGTIETWYSRVHELDLPKLKAQIEAHLSGGSVHLESQHRIQHQDGTYLWVLARGLRVADAEGRSTRMAGSLTDVTQQVLTTRQIEHNAFYDSLTGLPNRALFMQVLGRAMARTRGREQTRFAVLFLDLDRFKVVNDSLGHARGDELLVQVAARLQACLRGEDLPARLGGDEFTLLVDQVEDIASVTALADRIQEELSRPFTVGQQELFLTCSIGIAFSSARYSHPEDMLRDADTAMYRAKTVGRARYAIFDEEMHADVLALLRLETDLRRGLEKAHFEVFYQPIVNLGTGALHGFESLVRWEHPERGLLAPGEFIALAEETGLILMIDRLVLGQVGGQAREWQKAFPEHPLSISVNMSGKQFVNGDLVDHIQGILAEFGLNPGQLKLEITEGALLERPEEVALQLGQIRELGVPISLDDFGTGYSSLSYLHRFPIDTLKIDQSFVRRMVQGGKDREIVQTILTLGHNLGMEVVAEGVESTEQRDMLSGMNCDYGQGYFFAEPLSRDAATQLIAEQRAAALRQNT